MIWQLEDYTLKRMRDEEMTALKRTIAAKTLHRIGVCRLTITV